MGDFDAYDYLEKQLEKKEAGGEERPHKERKHKDRDGEKDKDRHKEKRRHSERGDREERHRSSRHRSRSRERRSGPAHGRLPSPPRRREATPPEVREARARQKELEELDRDIRTVFAFNLPLKAEERDLFMFFSKAGEVGDVKIIKDRNTHKSKGFAYIEFVKREDIVSALALTGQILMNQAVMVKSSEAEKNLAWEAAQAQASAGGGLPNGAASVGNSKLQVNNLRPEITEADLRNIFTSFGVIEDVSISRDSTGRSLGTGFVHYSNTMEATKALQQLDGLDVGGAQLSVRVAPMSASEAAAAGVAQMGVDLDHVDQEGEHGGLKLSADARAALMNRLAGMPGAPTLTLPGMVPGGLPQPPPVAPSGPVLSQQARALELEQGLLGPASPIPTQCLLVKNMFNPLEETDPEWDKEIGVELQEECAKYGATSHVFVDKNSNGFVYLKFRAVEGAAAAQKALHGRWFSQRQLVAAFQFAQPYNAAFQQ